MFARIRLAVVPALAVAVGLALPAAAFTFGSASDRFEYALVDPGPDHGSSFSATSMSWEKLERLMKGETEPFFWFAIDGRTWIARDATTVAEATRILEPVRELGKKQGKLGAQQGLLGARLAMLASRSAWGERESKATRAERRRIEEEMEALGEELEALGRRQEPSGEEPAKLGAHQAELGRQQASVSKRAGAELRRLAGQAMDDGRARRAD